MSLEDCAEALREHDPDRFAIALLAGPDARPRLLTLYALNLELARAPLASAEPLVAEMRLQWWVERLEDIGAGQPQSHELLAPLAQAWGPRAAAFAALAEPRRRDCERRPFDSAEAVATHIRASAVPLAKFAAEALDAPKPAMPAIAAQALGVGLARWLLALPALQGLGLGLRDPAPAATADLARRARAALSEARAQRRHVPRHVAPVLFPGAGLRAALNAAPQGPEALARLAAPSEFSRRFAQARFALTHRWWL